jgi:hypothetical protein
MFERFWAVSLLVCLLIGGAAIVFGLYARACLNPKEVHWFGEKFVITMREQDERITFELTRGDVGQASVMLTGSTDLLCDPPYLMLLDINGDGLRDLYFHHCGGHGFVSYQSDSNVLHYEDLGQFDPGDAPKAHEFWGREIQAGGVRMIGFGCSLVVIGILALLSKIPLCFFNRQL